MIELVTTIIGWNVPSSANFMNGIIALIIPLAGVGLFAGIPTAFGMRGDLVVTMALIGMTVGSVLGTLTLTLSGGGSTGSIPFALVMLSGTMLVLWLWRGQGR